MTNRDRTLPVTPGFDIHLTIEFKTTRTGQRQAWYWSPRAFRKFRVSLVDAELWVAQGLATKATGALFSLGGAS
jgi:hypothetical protein